jgi:hypothetical protein
MLNKLMFFLCFLLVSTLCFAEVKGNNENITSTTYNNFMGKTFIQYEQVDPELFAVQFDRLYNKDDDNYSVSICRNSHDTAKSKWYLFFTKFMGYKGKQPVHKILDTVTVDMNNFPNNSTIWLDECECKGQKSCNTIAIYYHDEEMAKKGIMVKPLKVWKPNIATGKLEEVSPNSVRCGSEAPED